MDWLPIETAPKDGTLMLLANTDWVPAQIRGEGAPIKVGGYWEGTWNIFGASWWPTHWCPLPPPPHKESENG